ncbi:hypothetical protein [Emticicia sp. C21]|uniref:hypothetical protein n=1 Tax=Emticicia sp. C21 TaxID=2302915 RepID=UPI000E34FF61|nr:hypothetical protein [Emticicia sp. C21]RFS15215.1 hypothetical protein D0T08_16950 [Emticicia sp. C21]
MKKPKLLLPDLKILLQNQNFILQYPTETEPRFQAFFESVEMLALLNKISLKKRLSSQIYLAMIHFQFKDFIQLSSPGRWQLSLLVLIGRTLGYRI